VRWGGKWATAWHDGGWGVFPAKSIELERPRRHEVPPMHQTMGGVSSPRRGSIGGVSVVARWKFDPKDAADKGWLAFDKGDTIRNVGWLYKDHWCWSGTNAKGRVGVFPRSYVLFEQVKEEPQTPSMASFPMRPATAKSAKKLESRLKLFGRSRTGDDGASTSSGGNGIVEIISR
jgi:hypothetical protein